MGGLDELDRVWDHLDPDDPIIFRHTVAGVVPARGNYSRAPVRKMQDYINGGWKSDNVIIDIDFGKGTYTQYLKQHADTFPLSFLDGKGSAIRSQDRPFNRGGKNRYGWQLSFEEKEAHEVFANDR